MGDAGMEEAVAAEREQVGRNVASIRGFLRLTVGELAAASGISATSIRRIERGVANPRLRVLARLAGALGFPLEAFFVRLEVVGRRTSPYESDAPAPVQPGGKADG